MMMHMLQAGSLGFIFSIAYGNISNTKAVLGNHEFNARSWQEANGAIATNKRLGNENATNLMRIYGSYTEVKKAICPDTFTTSDGKVLNVIPAGPLDYCLRPTK